MAQLQVVLTTLFLSQVLGSFLADHPYLTKPWHGIPGLNAVNPIMLPPGHFNNRVMKPYRRSLNGQQIDINDGVHINQWTKPAKGSWNNNGWKNTLDVTPNSWDVKYENIADNNFWLQHLLNQQEKTPYWGHKAAWTYNKVPSTNDGIANRFGFFPIPNLWGDLNFDFNPSLSVAGGLGANVDKKIWDGQPLNHGVNNELVGNNGVHQDWPNQHPNQGLNNNLIGDNGYNKPWSNQYPNQGVNPLWETTLEEHDDDEHFDNQLVHQPSHQGKINNNQQWSNQGGKPGLEAKTPEGNINDQYWQKPIPNQGLKPGQQGKISNNQYWPSHGQTFEYNPSKVNNALPNKGMWEKY